MSDDKIVSLFGSFNAQDLEKAKKDSVKEAFEKAQGQNISDVIIMGWTSDGNLVMSFACDSAPEMVFMLEMAKREIIDATRN